MGVGAGWGIVERKGGGGFKRGVDWIDKQTNREIQLLDRKKDRPY